MKTTIFFTNLLVNIFGSIFTGGAEVPENINSLNGINLKAGGRGTSVGPAKCILCHLSQCLHVSIQGCNNEVLLLGSNVN